MLKDHEVTIFEKESQIGGIAKVKSVEGAPYHTIGGHCLNSKNEKIMNFVFNEVLEKDKWHKVKRDAKINFRKNVINYPIEFSIKEIAKFDKELAFSISRDFLAAEDKPANNLGDWFKENFGKTLADEYFIPYNRKIWNMDPYKMSHEWVDGKLPLPNKKAFFNSLIGHSEDTMPHNTFYYPNSNCQNSLFEALAKNLNIIKNFEIKSINKIRDKWIINNSLKFDLVISTIPLNILPKIITNTPKKILNEVKKLKYNKVSNMLWKTKPIKHTWTYYPSDSTIFHRHIHIGNFLLPKQNFTITESVGEYSYEVMFKEGKKYDYLLEPIDFNISDHAYVVYDHNYSIATSNIKKYLNCAYQKTA